MFKLKVPIVLIFFAVSTFAYSSDHFSVSLWMHSDMFSSNKKIAIIELNEKLEYYGQIGIENLYVFRALKNEHKKGWDFLKYILKVAHKIGLKVHPVITPGYRVKIEGKIRKHPEWLIKDPFGKTLPYLNLSNQDVRKYIRKKAKKLLKYNIDGIHLDYIRFPYISSKTPGDSIISNIIKIIRILLDHFIPDQIFHGTADNYFSYDRKTLNAFQKQFQEWDGSQLNEREYILNEWREWNTSNVTQLVVNIRKIIKRSGKNIPLSAAIISNRDFALGSLGQDWEQWRRSGSVDVLCPMIYSNDSNWFKERLKGVLRMEGKGCKVYAGIAIESSTNKNTPEGVASQIQIAMDLGADGVVFFSGNSLTKEFGKIIKEKVER